MVGRSFRPLQKLSANHYFLRYKFSPTFYILHSGRTGAILRARAWFLTAQATNWLLTPPLQKLSANHYFYDTSFHPLFCTVRSGRPGVVLRAREWFWVSRCVRRAAVERQCDWKACVAPPERWYRTRRGYPYLMEVPQGCNHTQKYHPKKTPTLGTVNRRAGATAGGARDARAS